MIVNIQYFIIFNFMNSDAIDRDNHDRLLDRSWLKYLLMELFWIVLQSLVCWNFTIIAITTLSHRYKDDLRDRYLSAATPAGMNRYRTIDVSS